MVRNPADAEAAVGDVYLQVWEKACDFRSDLGCVLGWLKTLAWSRAVDRQRRGRKYAMEVELHPGGTEAAYTGRVPGNRGIDRASIPRAAPCS